MSVGACTVGTHSGSTLASADAALYEAKNSGRNRVVQAPACMELAAPELPTAARQSRHTDSIPKARRAATRPDFRRC